MEFSIKPIAFAHNSRKEPVDDDWSPVVTQITLVDGFALETLLGLEDFSHVEIIYVFHRQDPNAIVIKAAHPRENPAWPLVGIFAQRKKARPNRLGATIAELVAVTDRTIVVRNFDGIDGTPVVDIKPVFQEYLPARPVRQPEWSTDLMKNYW